MSLSTKIAKGTFTFLSSNLFLNAISFITTLVVIRTLGKEDYGYFVLSLSIYSVSSVFLDPGISHIVASEVARSRGEKRHDIVKRLLLRFGQIQLLSGALLLAIFALLSFFAFIIVPGVFATLLPVLGIYVFFSAIAKLFSTTFYGFARYGYMALFRVSFSIARFGAVLVLVVWAGRGVLGAVITYPLASAISILVLTPLWWKMIARLRLVNASVEPVFRWMLKTQGPYAVALYSSKTIRGQIPLWFLQMLLGPEAVSLYAVSDKGLQLLRFFLIALHSTLLPLTAERVTVDWKTTMQMLTRSVKYALWVSLPMVIGVIMVAPWLYQVLLTGKYQGGVLVFRVLCLYLLIESFSAVENTLLFALQSQKFLFYAMFAGMIVHALLTWPFVSLLGTVGAAWVLLVRGVIVAIYQYYLIKRLKPDFCIQWRSLWHIDEFDRKLFLKIRRQLFPH